ncbi:unnamed protein product [Effrenium voratum]|uniref:Uncharacterized protein n=1 Tax=Effrenium voratum TaxID=2562239 RepID=A0AA36JEL5_9DINO|nr:unnamed protein product [Effrenium voratum]
MDAMQLWSLQPGVVTYQVLLPAMEAGGGFVPQGLWPSEPRRQVEALELLEATGGVPVLAPAKFAKMVYLPRLFPALRQLAAGSSAPGGPRLHEPQLEQHFSLGALFTSAALQDLDMDRSSPWLGSARNFAWKAFMRAEILRVFCGDGCRTKRCRHCSLGLRPRDQADALLQVNHAIPNAVNEARRTPSFFITLICLNQALSLYIC